MSLWNGLMLMAGVGDLTAFVYSLFGLAIGLFVIGLLFKLGRN